MISESHGAGRFAGFAAIAVVYLGFRFAPPQALCHRPLCGLCLPLFLGKMTSQLEQPVWSVLSDRGCEASSLNHEEARRLVHQLGGEGRHGLCIVTDEAASRMSAEVAEPQNVG